MVPMGDCNCHCCPCVCPCSAVYEVTLAGIAAGTCLSGCLNFNRTWTLTRSQYTAIGDNPALKQCRWWQEITPAARCGLTALNMRSTGNNSGIADIAIGGRLGAGSATFARYIFSGNPEDMDCEGSNVLDLNTAGGSCTGWPATITITRVP